MMTSVKCFLGIALLSAAITLAAADSSSIGGPVLGLVFDPESGLRTIQGIPGASVLSKPLNTGLAMRQATISPRQDYVIAAAGDDLDLFVIKVVQGAASVTPLPQADRGPGLIGLSPSGSSVAFYYGAARKVQVLTGLPDAPVMAGEFDISSLPAQATALGVSDDGSLALAAFGEETAASVFVLAAGSEPRFLSVFGHVTAIAFQGGTRNALIADDRENKIYLLRNAQGPVEWNVLAGEGAGIAGPVAVASSKDNRKVYVANQANSTVTALDLAGGPAATASCSCKMSGLFPLNGNAVFRLAGSGSQPIWLLDGDAGGPKVVFVPAAPKDHRPGRRRP